VGCRGCSFFNLFSQKNNPPKGKGSASILEEQKEAGLTHTQGILETFCSLSECGFHRIPQGFVPYLDQFGREKIGTDREDW
jgi:hypothetical protein